ALVYILGGVKTVPDWLRPIHSHNVRLRKSSNLVQETESSYAVLPARDARFRARITSATEWTDLELLFRTLAKLKAEPLILSMPIDADAAKGISQSTREVYYERMRRLPIDYTFP